MTEDVLADWKRNKFIVADYALIGQAKHIVVLTNIQFWAEHADALADWCEKNPRAKVQGMTVEISDDRTLTHFIMRWT
jgi:hypothetical protein